MLVRSQYPDVEIPDVTLHELLFASLRDDELGRTAVVDGLTGARTTYGELRDQVDAVAGAFAAHGVRVGDVVALHTFNQPAFVAVLHGLLRAGATVTTVDGLATGEEVARQLRVSRARTLVTVGALLPAAVVGSAAAGVADVVVLDGADAYPALADGYPALADLLAAGGPAPVVRLDPATHLAVLPFSPGTVGEPHGVMLTHRNLVANTLQALPLVDVRPDDVLPAVLPFFHVYGVTLLHLALRARATLVTLPRFDLAQYLDVIERERATYLFVAPPIAHALGRHPLTVTRDLSSVRVVFSGAAALDPALADVVARRLDARVVQGFGMSEMSPVSHVVPVDRTDIPAASIGLLVPNMEARVVDPATGWESPVGELLCRGPNVMVGYLGDEAATRDAIDDDGFLHTGDVVSVDAQGVFTLVDRLGELITYKGYPVAPAELEALLLEHPAVADAAVVGLPDDEAGEVPKAYVVPVLGARVTPEEVATFVAARVAPYKKVRKVELVDAVPKSPTGKILRKQLREREAARAVASQT